MWESETAIVGSLCTLLLGGACGKANGTSLSNPPHTPLPLIPNSHECSRLRETLSYSTHTEHPAALLVLHFFETDFTSTAIFLPSSERIASLPHAVINHYQHAFMEGHAHRGQ